MGIPGTGSALASAVSTDLAGLGSCGGRGLEEGGDQGRGCSLCYFELLTGAAERRLGALGAPGQAMRVSVLLTPNPGKEMSQAPHDVSSFREGRHTVVSPDVAEVGGEEGVGLPWDSSLSYLVERSVHSPSCLKIPTRQGTY